MFNIIISNLGKQEVNTVNARELHTFIESKQEFANWIKSRILQYDFVENQDFITLDKIIKGGKATDYHISLDMAKELSMVERNAKGKEARQYFIECEKKVKQATTPPKELSRMDLIRLAMEAEQENQELRTLNNQQVKVITEQKDVIEAQDDFIDSAFKLHDTMSVDYYCKLISSKHNHFGAVKFRNLMKISGRFVINRDSDSYMPSQEMINIGQMEYKAREPYIDSYGVKHEHTQIRITKKGARTLYAICKKYQNFFKLNDNETKGYQYKPLCERRDFLNSLLVGAGND